MKEYYNEAIKPLKLAGMSKSTQDSYVRSVRQLVDFYDKSPDLITEKELQNYFLHKKDEDQWAAATLRISQCGTG